MVIDSCRLAADRGIPPLWLRDHKEPAPRLELKRRQRVGFVAGAVRRERYIQNSPGYVNRRRWRDRNLRDISSRFVVVRFGHGNGLGRDGLLGKKSDLAAFPFSHRLVEQKWTGSRRGHV